MLIGTFYVSGTVPYIIKKYGIRPQWDYILWVPTVERGIYFNLFHNVKSVCNTILFQEEDCSLLVRLFVRTLATCEMKKWGTHISSCIGWCSPGKAQSSTSIWMGPHVVADKPAAPHRHVTVVGTCYCILGSTLTVKRNSEKPPEIKDRCPIDLSWPHYYDRKQ